MRPPRIWLRESLFVGLLCTAVTVTAEESTLTIASLRKLNAVEAARALPITIEGVLTANLPYQHSFFLQDASGGIYVETSIDHAYQPGDRLLIAGHTIPGDLITAVVADKIAFRSKSTLPAPHTSLERILSGSQTGNRVQLQGLIRSVFFVNYGGRQLLGARLQVGESALPVYFTLPPRAPPAGWIGAQVRVEAVASSTVNRRREFVSPRLIANSVEQVMIVAPAPSDPFAIPQTSIHQVLSEPDRTGAAATSRHISGIVTWAGAHTGFYLQSGNDAIWVHSAERALFRPGARIEAVGYVEKQEGSVSLQDALVRRLPSTGALEPSDVRASEIISPNTRQGYVQYESLLVRIEGTLVDTRQSNSDLVIHLEEQGRKFEAMLPIASTEEIPPGLARGERVRLTGVCIADRTAFGAPVSFRIAMRQQGDIEVIHESWLTPRAWALIFVFAVGGGVLLFALILRRARIRVSDISGQLQHVAQGLNLYVAAASLTLLIGVWGFGQISWRVFPEQSTAVSGSALLCLFALALARFLQNSRQENWNLQLIAKALAVFSLMVAALHGVEYITGPMGGFDDFFLKDPESPAHGRIARFATVAFVLLASRVLLPRLRMLVWPYTILLFLTATIAGLNLVGFAFGVYRFAGFTTPLSLSFPIALGLFLLCAASFATEPNLPITALLAKPRPSAFILRYLLPVVIVVPILLSWLEMQGEFAHLFSERIGAVMLASSIALLMTILLLLLAASLARFDFLRERAQRRFLASQAHHTQVLDHLPLIIWTATADGVCDYVNEALFHFTGIPTTENLEQVWQKALNPEDAPEFVAAWASAIARQRPFDGETRMRSAAGQYEWHVVHATPVRSATGTVLKWLGYTRNVHASRLAEIELRSSEARLRELANAVPAMLWITGPKAELLFVNHHYTQFTGFAIEESRDGAWLKIVHPEDLPRCFEIWQSGMAAGKPYEIEYRLRAASGDYRWHVCRSVPVHAVDGTLREWYGIALDMHAAKEAEAEISALNRTLEARVLTRTVELESANARIEAVLNASTQVAIIAADADGYIELFNPGAERILQYSASEMIGLAVPALTDVRPTTTRGNVSEAESTLLRRDGTEIDLKLAITTICTVGGKPQGTLTVATDITPQKTLERELRSFNEQLRAQTVIAEDANRAKSSFLAAMSHEIRTPLNAILGMADLLAESPLTKDQGQYVKVFQSAGATLLDLINDILDLSKIEAGQIQMESIPFSLQSVAADSLELVRHKLAGKGVALRTNFTWTAGDYFLGDPTRLRQILLNLLGNAVKFTSTGTVEFAIEEMGASRFRFTISDTGIGIEPKQLEAIFEDFQQADSSTTRKFGGTGLGLGIARRLVSLMGGKLEVTSAPQVGSSFFFTIPMERTVAAVPATRPIPLAPGLEKLRILIAEDSEVNRFLIHAYLKQTEHVLTFVENGEAAVEAASKEKFDVILMDMQMPILDGYDATRQIRRHEQATGQTPCPILALTANALTEDVLATRAAGCDTHLSKPISKATLFAALAQFAVASH